MILTCSSHACPVATPTYRYHRPQIAPFFEALGVDIINCQQSTNFSAVINPSFSINNCQVMTTLWSGNRCSSPLHRYTGSAAERCTRCRTTAVPTHLSKSKYLDSMMESKYLDYRWSRSQNAFEIIKHTSPCAHTGKFAF